MKYIFIDTKGWEFPKYLEILKQFEIYKAEEDYLNLNLEEPIDFGDCFIISYFPLVAYNTILKLQSYNYDLYLSH